LSLSQIVYQLRINSDVPLPGPAVTPPTETHDLRVTMQKDFSGRHRLAHSPPDFFYVSPTCNEQGHPTLRVGAIADGSYFALLYADGVQFVVDRSGQEIWVDWPETSSLEDAATYLMGPVMGYVLRRRGIVSLHASAVSIDGRAIALVGEAGAGKSTTAAAFATLGYGILSDDLVPLDDRKDGFLALPGYPRINLWPDSVRALFGSEEALPRITPTWEKRFLALDREGYRFESNPLPLAAIYVLAPRDSAAPRMSFEEQNASTALITLVKNTYVNYLMDPQMRRHEFDIVSRLVSAVSVRSVRPPDDPLRLREFCEAIATDARKQISLSCVGPMSEKS